MQLDQTQKIGIGLFTAMLVIFALQSFLRGSVEQKIANPEPDMECEGEPIRVDFGYYGGYIEPHTCKVQCDDGVQHFILYSNGKGTQCSPLPACLDWGEDRGVTCKVPEEYGAMSG